MIQNKFLFTTCFLAILIPVYANATEVKQAFEGNLVSPKNENKEKEEYIKEFETQEQVDFDSNESSDFFHNIDNDLDFNYAEIKTKFKYSLGVAIGVSAPWQNKSLVFNYFLSSQFDLGVLFGEYNSKFKVEYNKYLYEIELKSKSFLLSANYHIEKLSFISLKLDLGYGSFKGSVDSLGIDEISQTAKVAQIVNYNTGALLFGVGIKMNFLWKFGLAVNFTPLGIYSMHPLKIKYENDFDEIDNVLKNTLNKSVLYGITNLEIGYAF